MHAGLGCTDPGGAGHCHWMSRCRCCWCRGRRSRRSRGLSRWPSLASCAGLRLSGLHPFSSLLLCCLLCLLAALRLAGCGCRAPSGSRRLGGVSCCLCSLCTGLTHPGRGSLLSSITGIRRRLCSPSLRFTAALLLPPPLLLLCLTRGLGIWSGIPPIFLLTRLLLLPSLPLLAVPRLSSSCSYAHLLAGFRTLAAFAASSCCSLCARPCSSGSSGSGAGTRLLPGQLSQYFTLAVQHPLHPDFQGPAGHLLARAGPHLDEPASVGTGSVKIGNVQFSSA